MCYSSTKKCKVIHFSFFCAYCALIKVFLLYSDHKNIRKHCPLQIQKSSTYIQSLGNNVFITFHDRPTTATRVCKVDGKTERSSFQVGVIDKFYLQPNCFAIFPEYTLFSVSDTPVATTTLESFRWGIHFDSLIPSIGGPTIHKIVAMFDNTTSLMPPMDPHLYSSIHNDMVQMQKTHFSTYVAKGGERGG